MIEQVTIGQCKIGFTEESVIHGDTLDEFLETVRARITAKKTVEERVTIKLASDIDAPHEVSVWRTE